MSIHQLKELTRSCSAQIFNCSQIQNTNFKKKDDLFLHRRWTELNSMIWLLSADLQVRHVLAFYQSVMHYIVLCLVFMCLLRSLLKLTVRSHWVQANLLPSWTAFMWAFKWPNCMVVYPHLSQEWTSCASMLWASVLCFKRWGLLPVSNVHVFCSFESSSNDWILHLNFFGNFLCFTRSWSLRLLLSLVWKLHPSSSQLKLKPSCFTLMCKFM